jgi:hypothetical protein
MSLWRKRNVQHNEHNEQKHDILTYPLDILHDLSIKSEDLSIKSWVGLTENERYKLWLTTPSETEDRFAFAKAIEQALKERNT